MTLTQRAQDAAEWMDRRPTEPEPRTMAEMGPLEAQGLARVLYLLAEKSERVDRFARRWLDQLEYRQTGRDPKNNGFAYACVPDWALRQLLDDGEAAKRESSPAQTSPQPDLTQNLPSTDQ